MTKRLTRVHSTLTQKNQQLRICISFKYIYCWTTKVVIRITEKKNYGGIQENLFIVVVD